MVRFLCIGESLLTDMSPSLTMQICLKVLVASHLLLSLKVGEINETTLIRCLINYHCYLLHFVDNSARLGFFCRVFLLHSSRRTEEL